MHAHITAVGTTMDLEVVVPVVVVVMMGVVVHELVAEGFAFQPRLQGLVLALAAVGVVVVGLVAIAPALPTQASDDCS